MLEREPCDEWVERVSAYADGELREAEESAVAAHLDSCDACRDWLEQARADRSAMVESFVAEKRRRRFTRAVMREVGKRPAFGNTGQRSPWWRRTAVALGACVLLLCLLGSVLLPVCGRSRARARQTVSVGQRKQLALATPMYASEYGDEADTVLAKEALAAQRKRVGNVVGFVDGDSLSATDSTQPTRNRYDALSSARNSGLLYEASPQLRQRLAAAPANAVARVERTGEEKEASGRQSALGPPERNYGLPQGVRIAYEAEEDVEVKDVPVAVMAAEQEIANRAGFLLSSDLTTAEGRTEARVVFRVPSKALFETMNALAKLGMLVSRHMTGEDLTEEYVAAERGVESEAQKQARLRPIGRRVRSSDEKMSVSDKIAASHAEAERQRGTVRGALARTVLATGSVRFLEPEPLSGRALVAAAGRAWRSSGRTWQVVATAGIWLGAYLPFGAGVAVLVFLGRYVWRRRRKE